jgi:hypothetical protein
VTLGGFPDYPFTGKITDFNLWKRPLSFEEAALFTTCQSDKVENETLVVSWRKSKLTFTDNLIDNVTDRIVKVPTVEVCANWLPIRMKLFNRIVTFDQAVAITKNLGREIFLPTNELEMTGAQALDIPRFDGRDRFFRIPFFEIMCKTKNEQRAN